MFKVIEFMRGRVITVLSRDCILLLIINLFLEGKVVVETIALPLTVWGEWGFDRPSNPTYGQKSIIKSRFT